LFFLHLKADFALQMLSHTVISPDLDIGSADVPNRDLKYLFFPHLHSLHLHIPIHFYLFDFNMLLLEALALNVDPSPIGINDVDKLWEEITFYGDAVLYFDELRDAGSQSERAWGHYPEMLNVRGKYLVVAAAATLIFDCEA
jgi:hypothetical protein